MENFLGKDAFVWWIGQVEDRNDPLGVGRCRVRIFGWHSDNVNELPTEELPWSQPLLPITAPNTFGKPKIGDWIFGFFLDSASGQAPVMIGILPGFVP